MAFRISSYYKTNILLYTLTLLRSTADSGLFIEHLVNLAKHFVNILKERSEADGTLKVHKDSAYTENPMERDDIEESIKVNVDDIYTSGKTSNM